MIEKFYLLKTKKSVHKCFGILNTLFVIARQSYEVQERRAEESIKEINDINTGSAIPDMIQIRWNPIGMHCGEQLINIFTASIYCKFNINCINIMQIEFVF